MRQTTFAFVKFLLFPFSLVYGLVVLIRNFLFDRGILRQTTFDYPIIGIGNLRVGGTGKTPMVALLIEHLERTSLAPAVVSRGYGRKTEGYKVVGRDDSAEQVGDEPSQLKKKYPEVPVVVSENRVDGITRIQQSKHAADVILLDDAMQHRAVKPGMLIMLSAYSKLYLDDFVLPVGRLREPVSSANRADIITITKCPQNLDIHTRRSIRERIRPMYHQRVFFSYEYYGDLTMLLDHSISIGKEELRSKHILLLTGIADASFLRNYLEDRVMSIEHLSFRDHHLYSEADMHRIELCFDKLEVDDKIILTTEKDAERLKKWIENKTFAGLPIYSIGHQMKLFDEDVEEFQNRINDFIRSYR